jgi:cytochrome c oxidase assembly protein subunit 15
MIPKSLTPKLIAMFILGGLQGALGWYMVKSGLVDDPQVSQYRLTAHLMMALAIYSYILWVAMDIIAEKRPYIGPVANYHVLRGRTFALTMLVLLTIITGGFVAGLKAGLVYNTFPLMGDSLVPPGLYSLQPWYLSALEDAVTVQFNHRVLAVSTFTIILAFFIASWRLESSPTVKKLLLLVLIVAIIQVGLGITTLLLRVPVAAASAHQTVAIILLTLLIVLLHHVRTGAKRLPG